MTFDAVEESAAGANKFHLFKFAYGGSDPYLYTDKPREFIDNTDSPGETYSPKAITCSAFKVSGKLEDYTLEVTLPADDPLAQLFIIWPPSQVVTLVVKAAHVGETEVQLVWTGRVLSCQFDYEAGEAKLACEPISSSLKRPGLRRRYGVACPWVLYNPETCKANKAAATSTVTVQSVGANTIGLSSGWNGGAGVNKYAGGFARWTNSDDGLTEVRRILSASTTSITLEGTIRGISATDSIDVILGCNRQASDCQNLHNNYANYGGQEFLPTKNPFEFVNLFY